MKNRSSRPESTSLIPVIGSATTVLPVGEAEIAELLEVPVEDLTSIPFGNKSTMWMSQAAQLDHDVAVNRAATHALKIASGLELTIRGAVVVHHEALGSDRN